MQSEAFILKKLNEQKKSDSIALIAGTEKLSYTEMIRRARHIGLSLVHMGIKKGDHIMLSMSRKADTVCTILGIFYAGAVFVPIDERWPEKRKVFVKSDTECVLEIDDDCCRRLLESDAGDAVLPEVTDEDTAAVVFTSGSTGGPKGAVLRHEIFGYCLDFSEGDGSLMKVTSLLCISTFAFVMTVWEVILVVSYGITLVVATDEEIEDPALLAQCMNRNQVDFFPVTPSVALRLIEAPLVKEPFCRLKVLILAGEPVSGQAAEKLDSVISGSLWMIYGSTEVMEVASCCWKKGEEISLMYPNPGVVLHLLNEKGEEVGPGEEGEICVAGPSADSGCYHRQPELTQKKYPVHPKFGRLFMTGDFGRRTMDGKIVPIGRKDGMVKLNGQRIEIGEVEEAMEAFPGISEAAVTIRKVKERDVLCGYFTSKKEVDIDRLKEILCQTLPVYMCPWILIRIERIPLGSNGKRVYRELPEPVLPGTEYVPPENEMEEMICNLFSLILDVPKVGVWDSFIALGGDSISGMKLAALLSKQGIEMELGTLFLYPCVRELAGKLSMKKAEDGASKEDKIWVSAELLEAVRESFGEDVEAVYPVTRHVESRFFRQGSFYPMAVLGEIDASFSEEELKERIMELSKAHVALRSKIVFLEGGRPVQIVLKQPKTEFFHVDLRKLSEDGSLSKAQKKYLSSLIRIDLSKQSELGEKVLFRLGLIRISDHSSVLYSGFSHYLLDGIGIMSVLMDLLGKEPVQPDDRIWQKRMGRIYGKAEEAVSYWKGFMDQVPEARPFPAAKSTPDLQTVSEERKRFFMSGGRKLHTALKSCAAERGTTVSILMIYAIGRALLKLQGTKEVVFYTMGTGRNAEDMLLPGMFTTSFPVRMKQGDAPEDLQRQLVASEKYAWIYSVPDAPLLVSEDLLLLNVQNVPASAGFRNISVTELMESSETLADSFFGVMDTALEIQAYPDDRFGFLGWCDPKRFDAAALESLLREALKELKSYAKEKE